MDIEKSKNLMERMGLEISRPRFDCAFDIFKKTGKLPLKEGIFKSYDAGFIIRILRQKFGFKDSDIRTDVARKKPTVSQIQHNEHGTPINDEVLVIEIIVPTKESQWLKDEISPFMEACGWYFSESNDISDVDTLLVFEKRLQEKEAEEYSGEKILYHITPLNRAEKILKIGLSPRTNAKIAYHPERIYMFPKELNEYETVYWIYQLANNEKMETIENGYAVLKIDRDECGDIKLFADPNMDGAVFTTDNIPKKAISIYKTYKFN